MILLFDENFSPKLVNAVKALGYDVGHVLNHLPQGSTDPQVFALASKLSACLVTKDAKIRRRKHEQEAYRQAGIGVFIFTGTAERSLTEQASFTLEVIETILALAAVRSRPFVFEITDRKKVQSLE